MAIDIIDTGYKQLTDIEHVLLRAEIYAGSRKLTRSVKYLMHADGKFYPVEVDYVPAALLFANELICNAFDEAVRKRRLNERAISTIHVEVDLEQSQIKVSDDGGIPVVVDAATNLLVPELIFGALRTGSNYTDERGDLGGQNGLGAKICNIFSDYFTVSTSDGKHTYQGEWTNHMQNYKEPSVLPCQEGDFGTMITAGLSKNAEVTRMPESSYDLTWARCIEARCIEVAAQAAGWEKPLTVTFSCRDGESGWDSKYCFKSFNDYLKLWPGYDRMVIDKQYRFNVAMCASNGAQESSAIVNALQAPWGTHIDAFVDACVWHIRAHINNKFRVDVKPAKIKSHIKTISTWQINAATFSGQTKEVLISEVKDFGMPVVPSEHFIKQLLRSEIVLQIVDELRSKLAEQRKAEIAMQQKQLDKQVKRHVLPQKLADAANAGSDKYSRLFVVEGDSAATGLRRFRNAATDGVFAMFGKSCGNMLYADELRVLANKALSALCQGLGFSLTDAKRLRYQHVVIACDADYDGHSICGLLLTFFSKFMPELIEQGRLFRLSTPIVIASNDKTGETRHFYDLAEFEQAKRAFSGKAWSVRYCKGLASLSDDDYHDVMQNPRLVQMVKDDLADSNLHAWFGNDSSKRKELMQMQDLVDDDILADIYNLSQDDSDEQGEAMLS